MEIHWLIQWIDVDMLERDCAEVVPDSDLVVHTHHGDFYLVEFCPEPA